MRKIRVFDVFSGAGGFSCGFEMAGCEIVGAIERDNWAAETFMHNHPSAKMLLGDIETFSDNYLKKEIISPDIIIGGPPCQGFSICVKNAGDPKDPRNSLCTEFIRMARIFSPKVMIMENVPNILKAKTKKGVRVVDIIESEFKKIGYNVYYKILTASDYGVPQMRQRFILIASKQAIGIPFPPKTHFISDSEATGGVNSGLLKCPTLWEAISDLPDIEACQGAEVMAYSKPPENDYQIYCRTGAKKLYNHLAMKHTRRLVERFSKMTWGQSVSDIEDDRLKQRKRNGNGATSDSPYDQNNRRMHPDRICHTITAAFYGNFVHPYKNRNFTAREGARIQSFPDTYVFKGKPTVVSRKLLLKEGRAGEAFLCQYSQIGNAVPPLMACAIAKNILKYITFTEEEKKVSIYVHGDNITQKENHRKKYQDTKSKKYLREIRKRYEQWKKANLDLIGPLKAPTAADEEIIRQRVALFNEYKDFIDQQVYAEKFDSRSNLHSTALEEFMYYLFKDLISDFSVMALIGKSRAFKDLSFKSDNYIDMLSKPGALVEVKDYDFVIGATINALFRCKGKEIGDEESFDMPAIAIECKTYLDKTMLESCSTTGEQLKKNNPNALYIIVAERLKLSEAVNLKNCKIDQIYILRKQKNTDREDRFLEGYVSNPIYTDVVWHLFCLVRDYLSTDWGGRISDGIQRGYLI